MPAQKNTNTEKNAAAKKAAKFAQLRQKAIDRGVADKIKINNKPFVLGEDYGFDPEITIPAPSLESTLVANRAMTAGDLIDQANAVFGEYNAARIIRYLDEGFDNDVAGASQALFGLILTVFEYFWGSDAMEVDGGFTS